MREIAPHLRIASQRCTENASDRRHMKVAQQHHLGYILAVALTPYGSRFKHLSFFGGGVASARRVHTLAQWDFGQAGPTPQQQHAQPQDTAAYPASPTMANSRFQYVKKFELSDALLPDTYLIARLDGHRFTKFTADHGFSKPNDERGLLLMAEVSGETSLWGRETVRRVSSVGASSRTVYVSNASRVVSILIYQAMFCKRAWSSNEHGMQKQQQ